MTKIHTISPETCVQLDRIDKVSSVMEVFTGEAGGIRPMRRYGTKEGKGCYTRNTVEVRREGA